MCDRLGCGMVRPRRGGRTSGRRGGRVHVHLDQVVIEQGNEETLPPPPVGGEDRIVVADDGELRQTILTKAHSSPFVVHPSSTKMNRDLKGEYYWVGLRKDIAELVSEGVVCQRVKTRITMDFGNGNAADTLEEELCMGYSEPIHQVFQVYREVLREFAYDLGFSIEFQPFVSSSDRWSVRMVIQVLEDMLRCCIIDFQSTWRKQLPLVGYAVSDRMFLTVSPWKKVKRCDRKGKLSPKFIGPYGIAD
ncbi:hypothetical protein GQ457_14G014030 [Hibiscus cannabinus]